MLAQAAEEVTQVDFQIHSLSWCKPQRQFHNWIKWTFTLVFDDLLAQDNDYYYRIKCFNADWAAFVPTNT